MLASMMFAAKQMLLYAQLNKYAWTFAQEDEEAAAPVSQRRKEVAVKEDDEDDDHEYMTSEGGFVCETVVADGLPKGAGIPTEVWLYNSVIKPLTICSVHTALFIQSRLQSHCFPKQSCICVMTEHAVLLERCCTLPWRYLPVRAGQSICWACRN